MSGAAKGWLGCVGAVAALVVSVGGLRADDGGPPEARRAAIVARIGPTRTITVGDVEDAVAQMPPFQRAAYGATPDAVRRRVLTDVLVRQELLALGAERAGIERRPGTVRAFEWARSAATVRAVRAQVGSTAPVAPDDVRAYYQANLARFESPERVRLYRILCDTREDAQRALDEAKADPTVKTFAALARDRSVDKASNLRAGDLGFLTADGTSNEPGLVVDAAIVRAAERVRDGEFVPAPVPEGDRFAVVWRRGTLAATHRTLADEGVADAIRRTLEDDRTKQQTDALVARLRAEKLHDFDATPLESIEEPAAAVRDGGEE
jgi:peptidyl-prolyl cis-trans isomerase C